MAFGIGLIGAGGNQKLRHIPGFREINDVEIVNVVNRSRESGERVATEWDIPNVSESVEELLADPGGRRGQHRHLALHAPRVHQGCPRSGQARSLRSAHGHERDRGRGDARCQPDSIPIWCHSSSPLRSTSAWVKTIKRLCEDGSLGSILEVHLTLLNGSGLDDSGPLHWRHRSDYSGHNMMQLGIFNETIQRWLGDTARVTAHARTFVPSRVDEESGERYNIVIPDSLGIFADMANGARCTYRVSAVTEGAPQPPSIDIYGSEGRLHWCFGDTGEWGKHGEDVQEIHPDPGTAHGWQVESDFINSVRNGAPVTLTNFADGVRYMRFTDAVWESWNTGQSRAIEPLAG